MPGNLLLIGAGGHAVGVAEAAWRAGWTIQAYADTIPASWLSAYGTPTQIDTDEAALPWARSAAVALGLGGIAPGGLRQRAEVLERYLNGGFTAPAIVHPDSTVSPTATLGIGVTVLARTVIHPFAEVGQAAIVNTGAIVEHHARIGRGAHIAPGAIVLGGASVGDHAMIGARAVILPGAAVPADTLIKAGSVYRG